MREDVGGGGDVGETELVVGVGRGGVSVGVGVLVDVTVAGAACVNVGSAVLICPEGWKGVGVGEALGSCVMRIKEDGIDALGAPSEYEVGEAQEASRVSSSAQ